MKKLMIMLLSGMIFFQVYGQEKTFHRKALVIGIQKYDHLDSLPNSWCDALDIKDSLTYMGWDVTISYDTPSSEFYRLLNSMSAELDSGAEAVLIYFSGHGVMFNSKPCLLLKDADLHSATNLYLTTYSIAQLQLKLFTNKGTPVIIIFDACQSVIDSKKIVKKVSKKLRVESIGQRNLFYGYSTSEGEYSYGNKNGRNSFYTAALKKCFSGHYAIGDLFTNANKTLSKSTDNRQIGSTFNTLTDDFYLDVRWDNSHNKVNHSSVWPNFNTLFSKRWRQHKSPLS